MSVTVTVAGQAGVSAPAGSADPSAPTAAATQPLAVAVTSVPGDWLLAVITWRQPAAGAGVTCSAGDDVHNWWYPLGQPSGTSSPAGVTRTAIWAAPAAREPAWVCVRPTGFVLALDVIVLDVAGLSPWSVLELITTGYAPESASMSMSLAAPPTQAFVIAAAASDNLTYAITLPGGGWPALTTQASDNGTDHTSDLQASTAWQVTTGATAADWLSGGGSGVTDFSGVLAAVAVTGSLPGVYGPYYTPYYPGPNGNWAWPYTVTEIAPGAGPGTPIGELSWTDLSSRVLASTFPQGRQYTLDSLQAAQGTMTLDNPDQALIPPGSGDYAGIDSGTPFRTRMAWPGGAWQMQWAGNGTTATPQAESYSNQVGVTAGVTYTASCWLGSSAPWADGMFLSIAWHNHSGYISSSVSPAVTGPGAALATVTAAAPAGATLADFTIGANGTPPASLTFYAAAAENGAGWLTMPPGVTWNAENGATVTTLAPWETDPRGAPNITPWYVHSAGYFQRWPPTWDGEMLRGQTKATTTDTWGYANKTLNSVLREEILADSPYAYWPLDDAAGSTEAANIAPGNNAPLILQLSKDGAGGATEAFGDTTTSLLGDTETYVTTFTRSSTPAGMWSQANVPSAVNQGYTLQCQDPDYPPIGDGVTISAFLQVTSGVLGADGNLWTVSDVHGPILIAFVATGGGLYLQYRTMSGTITDVTISAADYLSPAAMFHLAVTFDQTTYAAVLNGVTTVGGSFSSPISPAFTVFSVNGQASRVYTLGFTDAIAAHAAIHPAIVSQQRILSWHYAGWYGCAGEIVTSRIARLYGYTTLPGPLVMPADAWPANATSAQDIGDQAASTSLSSIAASTVPAVLAVAPTGDLCYFPRSYVCNQPARWVLGDDQAAGEIPVQVNYSPDYDPARVVDDIQITQLDDGSITVPSDSALEAASVEQYGDQTWQPTGYLQGDPTSELTAGPGLLDLANWVAQTQSKPYLRAASFTVDAKAHPSAWPFVAGAAVGDTAIINIRPATAGGQLVSITGRITQTSRALQFSQDGVAGSLTGVMDAAPELSVLTCDDPVRGQLDGENALAWLCTSPRAAHDLHVGRERDHPRPVPAGQRVSRRAAAVSAAGVHRQPAAGRPVHPLRRGHIPHHRHRNLGFRQRPLQHRPGELLRPVPRLLPR